MEISSGIQPYVSVLKLLADKTRLFLLKLLEADECCVCELVELVDVSQPAVSQHLRKLSKAGLVKEEKRSNWIFYSINRDSQYFSTVNEVLSNLPSQAKKLNDLSKEGKRVNCDGNK